MNPTCLPSAQPILWPLIMAAVVTLVAWVLAVASLVRRLSKGPPASRWVNTGLLAGACAIVAWLFVTCASGVIVASQYSSTEACPSQADRQRILANGLADWGYNAVFAIVLALPPMGIGVLAFVKRRKAARLKN